MSQEKSSVLCSREDDATGIGVSIIVKGEKWRNAVLIHDGAPPENIAYVLHNLANWIERKLNEK